jgi:hypothetical protein
VTFTASVESALGIPTGSVEFSIDGERRVAALDASGRASVATTFVDDGARQVVARYTASAGFEPSSSASLSQSVANAAPAVAALSGPAEPQPVGVTLSVAAAFTDAGVADTHSAAIDWGDSTTSIATVSERDGSGSIAASHAYTSAGIYRVTATVADDDGGVGVAALDALVVFDPAAGSARGAGWFDSPAAVASGGTGRAFFGFLARYGKDGATLAHPGLRLRDGGLEFESSAYEWLVITGTRATLRGGGRLNGSAGHVFELTAIDGEPDRLRIRIWQGGGGPLVYDTEPAAAEGADPTTGLRGGSIAIGRGAG